MPRSREASGVWSRGVRSPISADRGKQGVVLVQSGARDAYQVALALEQAGLLERLVTDLFWPIDRPWARRLTPLLPRSVAAMLRQRSEPGLPASRLRMCAGSGLATLLLDKLPGAPLGLRRHVTRYADRMLGRVAGRTARQRGAALLSYSYYAADAFRAYGDAGILFQLHPHPASMRRILAAELRDHPECARSLEQEWELALPEREFARLCAEPRMARSLLAASSFTRATLVENGTPSEAVRVIPYGVESTCFVPDRSREAVPGSPLRLLFVGRINQRKGIKYLLEALELLGTREVELTVCGRVVDDLSLFRPFADRVTIRPDVSAAELRVAYQSADLFVFPSVAEGFGQVLLESLASGLPILSTTHTAAPDLITPGRQGFIVEPRRPDRLAERIEWALSHRAELRAMRAEARQLAEEFTWARFRAGVVSAVEDAMSDTATSASHSAQARTEAQHAV